MQLIDRCWRHALWLTVFACAACDASRRIASETGVPAVRVDSAADSRRADSSLPASPLDAEDLAERGAEDLAERGAAEPPPTRETSPRGDAPVHITEIHYHPESTAPGSEFIEIVNAGPVSVSLGGWKLTKGVSFTFPEGVTLDPGAFTLIARSTQDFRRRFGDGPSVAGEFARRLDNAGELLRLEDAAGRTVSGVRYSDVAPWPEAADGQGPSLQRRSQERDEDDPANWYAAAPTPGGPGAATDHVANLSLFDLRHVPDRPAPDRSFTIAASAFHVSREVDLTLHYAAGGRERTVPMRRESMRPLAHGGHESSFSGIVPAQPASTVVEYWITARSEGDQARCPPERSPTPARACFVENAPQRTQLPVYHLLIEPGSLGSIMRNPWSDQLYPATFVHDGEVRANVQVRLRGSWARSWPKKSWKIFFPKGARLGKRDRINLNSAWRDAAFVRESTAYEIYERCGALSLRTKMVRLHVNGQFWGLFVDVEQPKETYLSRVGLPGAVLYKAASSRNQSDERLFPAAAEYGRHYENETHTEDTFEELQDFCRALASSQDVAEFFATRLDLPRYVNYLCASTLTQNWDAFNKNHFIAHDRQGSGKWYIIPWDVDRTLGDHWNRSFDSADLSLLLGTRYEQGATGWNRLVDRFFSEPSLKKMYMDRLAELLETTFTEEKLIPFVDGLAASIAAEAELDRRRWGGQGDWRRAVEQVRSFITRRRRFLLAELPGNTPPPPRNLTPADGERVASWPLALEVSAYRPAPSGPGGIRRSALAATNWQVREASSSYATPTLNLLTNGGQDSLAVPHGMLRPTTRYFWRVSYIDTNGRASAYSDETSFVTGDFEFKAVPVDLTSEFNVDLVAGPGDPSDDTVDGSRVLIVDGFDGRRTDNPVAGGLPRSGLVDVHRLGDYRVNNALQMTRRSSRDVEIPVEPGRYSFVRFLLTGANGGSRIPVSFVYSSGAPVRATLTCGDWYRSDPPDRPPREPGLDVVTILRGMDRIRRGSFNDNNRPSMFEVRLRADPDRVLTSIRLESRGAVYDSSSTTFNLFAATAIGGE